MTIGELQFDVVKEEDVGLIDSFLKLSSYQESNHNIVNLFMWKSWFPLWKHENENYLFLLGKYQDNYFLYMPLCAPVYRSEALKAAVSLFEHAKIPFYLSCYTEDMRDEVLTLFPDLKVDEIRDGFDYIYDKEKMISLSGKKLQKRRNHLNYFIRNYEHRVEFCDLKDYLDECYSFLSNWKNELTDDFLQNERMGTEYLLTHFHLFPACGFCVLIDGKVEGFIIGSYANEDMIQINVEKANDQFRGIYQYLEREFLQKCDMTVKWVNREDDMGYENLRKAKMASQPEYFIKKYAIKAR